MTKSVPSLNNKNHYNIVKPILPLLLLLSLLLLLPQQVIAAAATRRRPPINRNGSKNSNSNKNNHNSSSHYYHAVHNAKPVSSILPMKHLNLLHDASSGSSSGTHHGSSKNKNKKNEFDRLNQNQKYHQGPITRTSVHDAVVHMTKQTTKYDIVTVMGV